MTRRRFMQTSAALGAAGAAMPALWASAGDRAGTAPASLDLPAKPPARVALTSGNDRTDNVLRALRTFDREIAQAIGNRRVVIKPNNVVTYNQLAATHAGCLEAILEFLKGIGKLDGAVIAESAANGPAAEGFENYRYGPVAAKYGVKLLDLDQQGHQTVHVFDERDFRPHPVRMSRLLLDPEVFIISAAKLKTHDLVVATLSLKNIIFGAAVKDVGFSWRGGRTGTRNDKPIVHGGGFRGINYNLFALAQRLYPHLAVLDGYDGMEGNGPVGGRAVDHRVCVVSPDWLAADRVAVELMGIDFAKIGYLNYCAAANMGQADLKKIQIVGEPLARHIRKYRLADNVEKQLIWNEPPRTS